MTTERLTWRLLDTFSNFAPKLPESSAQRLEIEESAANLCANKSSSPCSTTVPQENRHVTQNNGCDRLGCVGSEPINSIARNDVDTASGRRNRDGNESDLCDKLRESVHRVDYLLENTTRKSDELTQAEGDHNSASGIQDKTGRFGGKTTVTLELMVHPGYQSKSADLGCGAGADEFACSPARDHELRVISSQHLLDWYQDQGITLVPSCAASKRDPQHLRMLTEVD